MATSRRYTPAIRDERLSGLFAEGLGLGISAGGLAHRFQAVKGRLDDGVADIRTRWRSRRLLGSAEPSARVHGQQQGEGVFQHAAVCIHVSRPSRGQGVSHEVLGAPRPTIWVSELYRAQPHPPAEDWQVCWAHHVRECQLALATGDAVCAPRMQAVVLRALASPTRRATLAASTL